MATRQALCAVLAVLLAATVAEAAALQSTDWLPPSQEAAETAERAERAEANETAGTAPASRHTCDSDWRLRLEACSDFYREGALLAIRTQDPQRQRESRLGAVQWRAGTTGKAGDLAVSASPALGTPQAPRWAMALR